jgi:hypothetical protein
MAGCLRYLSISRALGLLLVWLLLAGGVAAEPRRLGPAPEGSFTIVVIPDTQEYRGKGTKAEPKSQAPLTNTAFDAHMRWILANLQTQRIVFVSHVGDIVDINVPEQWDLARRSMDQLHGRVPYGIAVGNHDMKASGDSRLFQQYFPASRFAGLSWYGGCYAGSAPSISGNNANSYQRFSARGLDFVFLHLECNAPDDVLRWADGVLRENASRRAIITTHMGLGPLAKPKTAADFRDAPKGRMQWSKIHGRRGNSPQQMWDKCFRTHENLFLIFSGDQSRTQALRLASKNDAGRPVYELLSDYHDHWLRVNRFLPEADRIEVYTIDSRDGSLCEGTDTDRDVSQHQFTLEYEMGRKKGGQERRD